MCGPVGAGTIFYLVIARRADLDKLTKVSMIWPYGVTEIFIPKGVSNFEWNRPIATEQDGGNVCSGLEEQVKPSSFPLELLPHPKGDD